jgi:ribonucleoside-diphosphate reductase alpha chain
MSHAPFQSEFAFNVFNGKYPFFKGETWDQCAERVTGAVTSGLHEAPRGHRVLARPDVRESIYGLIRDRMFIPGGRYLYGSGRDFHQVNNCLLLDVEDTREGWADVKWRSIMALMTGAGIGVYYGHLREKNAPVGRTGGKSSGPVTLAKAVNEDGRAAVQGGDRRCAIWAGLPWWHPDIFEFIRAKDWPEWLREQKDRDWTVPAPLDMTNISVCLDDEFIDAYNHVEHPAHERAVEVYWKTIDKMVTTGEPGFSVDLGDHRHEVLRNACTEIVSADDSDVCNLGSLVLPKYNTVDEFERALHSATLFLTAGSLYSDVPFSKVRDTRNKNRRLGLGIIGVHEFCMLHGVKYGTDQSFEVLEPYMEAYENALGYAIDWQDQLGISRSVAATAIAPNGTIGIIAESTPSGDPLFSAANERAVITASPNGDTRTVYTRIDPVAQRLLKQGIKPEDIEDAYTLSLQPERRLAMQAFLQDHVDQAVSSTVNLEKPITDPDEQRIFGETLMKYLPRLRGITAYPNNARAAQPITPVPLEWALKNNGQMRIEGIEDTCHEGICNV